MTQESAAVPEHPFFAAEARRLASLIHGPSMRETLAARRALLLRSLSWVTRDGDGSMIWLPLHTWIPTLSADVHPRLSLADKMENRQYQRWWMTSFPRMQSRCALIVCQNCNSRKPTDVFLPCRRRRYSAAETLPETAMRASCSTSALCVPKASADYVTIAPIQTPQVTKHSSQLRWFRPSSQAHMTSFPRSQNPPAGVYRTHRAGPRGADGPTGRAWTA